MNYYYGGQFYGDEKITAKMDGWYDGGTEVVFACGGGIWTSAAEAADKHDGKLIGVDVDQNYLGVEGVESGKYKANPFVTSAMKGLGAAVKNGLDTVNAGDWSTIAGTNGNFGWKRATMLACHRRSKLELQHFHHGRVQHRSGEDPQRRNQGG